MLLVIFRSGGPSGGAPAAPSNLTATSGSLDGQPDIRLQWTNNAGNEDGFYIERSTNGVTFVRIATVGAGVVQYDDVIDLVGGETYYYRVQAFNGNGDSAYSNVASAQSPRRNIGISPRSTGSGDSPPVFSERERWAARKRRQDAEDEKNRESVLRRNLRELAEKSEREAAKQKQEFAARLADLERQERRDKDRRAAIAFARAKEVAKQNAPRDYDYTSFIGLPPIAAHGLVDTDFVAHEYEASIHIELDAINVSVTAEFHEAITDFDYESKPVKIDGSDAPDRLAKSYDYESNGSGVVKRKKPMRRDMLALIDPELASLIR